MKAEKKKPELGIMLHLYCNVEMAPLPSSGTFHSAAAADTIWL